MATVFNEKERLGRERLMEHYLRGANIISEEEEEEDLTKSNGNAYPE